MQILIGFGTDLFGQRATPHPRDSILLLVDQNAMRPDDWFEVPAHPIVLGSQAQKIQEHVERLAMVGLRCRRVVVAILVVISMTDSKTNVR